MTTTTTTKPTRSAFYAAPIHITETMRYDRATRALEILDGDEWFSVTDADGWAGTIELALSEGADQDTLWTLITEHGVETTRSTYVDDEPSNFTAWVMPDASVITDQGRQATGDELVHIWGDDAWTAPERIALQRVADLEGGA